MGRAIFTNNTDRTVYVAGRSVFPGSTIEVDARDLPGAQVAGPAPAALEPTFDAMAEALLSQRVPDIRQVLPDLEGDLDLLLQAERGNRNRRGVIEAIEAERLRRATETATDD